MDGDEADVPRGHIKLVFIDIDNSVNDNELDQMKTLCWKSGWGPSYCRTGQGNWSLDDVDYCITMSQAEEGHILGAVSILRKSDFEQINTPLKLFTRLHEATGKDFDSVGFIKIVILLLRSIHREDLATKLLPFLRWSCENSRRTTPMSSAPGSRRESFIAHRPVQDDGIAKSNGYGQELFDEQGGKALDEKRLRELLDEIVVPDYSQPNASDNETFLCQDIPLPALIFFILIFLTPTFNGMTYVFNNYVHPPATVQSDHTDASIETKKELLGRPVLYGLVRPQFPFNHDLSLHAENVRICLAKHKRCLIKGYFGEGKSHALSLYIHKSIGKYPAGVIWLREWKDIVAVADVIASHRGTDIVIRKEAAAAYLQNFLWNSAGWLLTIQDEHLWDPKDFKRVTNLFLNLETVGNHVIITSHRIPQALHDSIKVYEFNAGVHVEMDSCNGMVEEIVTNSISLTEEEKNHLLPIWKVASCNTYAIKRITNFINEWNFTIEDFVSHWNEVSKKEWLEILGFGPNSQALIDEMQILVELKERHPGVINFILDYIKTGKVKYEIPDCKLHDKYKGVPLLFILTELRDLSLANIVINPKERLCSIQMPALLRLLVEVTFLMKEDRPDRYIEGI